MGIGIGKCPLLLLYICIMYPLEYFSRFYIYIHISLHKSLCPNERTT